MKTDSMNQQQKREKAAELLGWKRLEHPITGKDIWTFPGKFARDGHRLPLYDEDLNLMFQAEEVLTDAQYQVMNDLLWDMMSGRKFTWHATAAQRLDAWLEVMMEEGS